MGLFGKLKENMNHGGVKVHIQAPSSVPSNQVIPVTITITADSAQTINSVKAEVKAQAREQGIGMGMGPGMNNGRPGMGMNQEVTNAQTVAEAESREPLTISPGETKTVNLQLFVNGAAGSGNPLAQLANAGGIGHALAAVASAQQAFGHVTYTYTIHASADVDGVTLDPSDKMPIELLPPTAQAAPAPAPAPTETAPAQQPPITPPLPPAGPVAPTQPL